MLPIAMTAATDYQTVAGLGQPNGFRLVPPFAHVGDRFLHKASAARLSMFPEKFSNTDPLSGSWWSVIPGS